MPSPILRGLGTHDQIAKGEVMLMIDRFKKLLPEIARIKRVVASEGGVYWEVYNDSGAKLGYAFCEKVPDSALDIPEAEEFDTYEVFGIVDLDYKVAALRIVQHPDHPGDLWAEKIVEPEFGRQYLGLASDEIQLSPEGRIDGITEATISSRLITDTIKNKVEEIMAGSR